MALDDIDITWKVEFSSVFELHKQLTVNANSKLVYSDINDKVSSF